MTLTALQRDLLRLVVTRGQLYYVASRHMWVPAATWGLAMNSAEFYNSQTVDPLIKSGYFDTVGIGRTGFPNVLKASGRTLELLA